MDADILVLGHNPCGVGQGRRHVDILFQVDGRRREARAKIRFLAIRRDGEALNGADVNACIAFDTLGRNEYGLDIAVEAALHFPRCLFGVETEFHFDVELLESPRQIDVGHLLAMGGIVIVVVTPFANPHLLADQIHALRRAIGHRDALAVIVDGDSRLVRVLHGPDDVLGPKCRVASEEDPGPGGLHGPFIHKRNIPLVELNTDVALDPGECVLLPDCENNVVGWKEYGVDGAGVFGAGIPFETFEFHSREAAILDDEALGSMVDYDLDAFLLGVLEFPRRSFEEAARTARHHLDVFTPESARRAAAVHGCVSDTDDQHALADGTDVAEGD